MFTIPELYSIGPFILPLHYLILALLGFSVVYFISYKCKKEDIPYKPWSEILFNGILTYFLVWKFSFILTDPLALFNNLSLLILSNGGLVGQILGALASLFVVYRTSRKANYSLLLFSDVLMYWLLITLTIYWLLLRAYGLPTTLPWGIGFSDSITVYHPVHLYQFLLGTSILFYLSAKRLPFGQGKCAGLSLFFLGVGLLMISNFTINIYTLWGLGTLQWMYIVMSTLGLSLLYIKVNDKQKIS
jgi:hypothetical protein